MPQQLPIYNEHGQCLSETYMQATTAPRQLQQAQHPTSIHGPILHDISHVHQQLTNGVNPDYVCDLPAHYLKHWGLLDDTGAYVSVAPGHFASEVPLEPVLHPVQPLTATSPPSSGQRLCSCFSKLSFYVRFYITDVSRHYWVCKIFYNETYN